LIDAA